MSSDSSSSQEPETTPEDRTRVVSNLCSLGMRPHLVDGLTLHYLRQHFCEVRNIENPLLRGLVWTDKIETTKIVIESLLRWKPEEASRRPSIQARRGDWTVQHRGIGDILQGGITSDGFDRYSTIMVGTGTLMCQASEGGMVELLAAEVYRFLVSFSPVLRENLNLLRYVVTGVGTPRESEEAQKQWIVPVTYAYGHDDSYTMHQDAPKLRTVALSIITP